MEQKETIQHPDTRPLMVSIRCATYNHEPYIRQCLEGFVMQKTNFRFEAIVHDDASTDGTAAIVREYAEKYPDIIKPIYETENLYSKHDGSIRRIMNEACKGKYIALCEGDDYWTDPNKLQKQIDFLEQNPEYSMCFHNALEHWENHEKPDAPFSAIENRDYSGAEIYNDWIVPTASVVMKECIYRTDIYLKAIRNPHFIYGDIITFLSCAAYGKLRGMKECMSVYRRHEGGEVYHKNMTTSKVIAHAYHNINIYKVFGSRYKPISIKYFLEAIFCGYLMTRADGKSQNKLLWDSFKVAPIRTIRFIFRRVLKKVRNGNG